METKHTPGPWRIAPAHEYSDTEINVDAGTRGYVAECGHRGDTEAEANARLIAAAPDGLAFAQSICENEDVFHAAVNRQPVTPERAQELLAEIYEAARLFIAKAEGCPSPWTIEYRREAGGFELKQGSAHRGIYRSEDEARLEIARLGG